jgi:uncharacterized delta-60 repeat protein
MRKNTLLFGLILGICASVFGEEPPVQRWVERYDYGGQDSAGAMAIDSSGNIYVTGGSEFIGYYDYATIKYDPNGNQLWVARYGFYEDAGASALALDKNGNIYVTGSEYIGNHYSDYATVKYDTNGNQLWVARYNGPESNSDRATALAVDNSGNVYVTGHSDNGYPDYVNDYATVKYDTNGNQLWVARYNGPANADDFPYALAVDSSGNVYVTGTSLGTSYPGSFDYATVKYDTNGNQLWVARYNGPAVNQQDNAYDLKVDLSGNVYVTGGSVASLNRDYATVKYNTDGNELWVARYNYKGFDDEAYALALDNAGNVYVTGTSYFDFGATNYATIKYDTDGNQLWAARSNQGSYATELALDSSGNVYVTGYNAIGGSSFATMKYAPDGNQLWVKEFNAYPLHPGAKALAVDNSGNVYVAGYTYDNHYQVYEFVDYVTIKYTQHDYCISPVIGDFNNDCKVDFADFAILAAKWLEGI